MPTTLKSLLTYICQKLMKQSLLIIIYLTLLISCSEDDPNPNDSIIISKSVNDTIIYAKSIDNSIIPIFFSFPRNLSYPLPATVVMHGSGGNWQDVDTNKDGIADEIKEWELSNQNTQWKQVFDSKNIVSAFPDSYSSRGTIENEGEWKNPPLQFKISATFVRNYDAYLTLELLRKMVWEDGTPVVKTNKVAIIGFSHGATAVQSTLFDTKNVYENWEWSQSFNGIEYKNEILAPAPIPSAGGFIAGVMYYPGSFHNSYYGNPCKETSIFKTYSDFMIHLPSKDDLTDNSLCMLETVKNNQGGTATMYYYENVDHGFDGDDSEASFLAMKRTLDFLLNKLE